MSKFATFQEYRRAYGDTYPGYDQAHGANLQSSFVAFLGELASQMGLGSVMVAGSAEATTQAFYGALDAAIAKAATRSPAVTASAPVAADVPVTAAPPVTAHTGLNADGTAPVVYDDFGREPAPAPVAPEPPAAPPVVATLPPRSDAPFVSPSYDAGRAGNPPQWQTLAQSKAPEPQASIPWGLIIAALAFMSESK